LFDMRFGGRELGAMGCAPIDRDIGAIRSLARKITQCEHARIAGLRSWRRSRSNSVRRGESKVRTSLSCVQFSNRRRRKLVVRKGSTNPGEGGTQSGNSAPAARRREEKRFGATLRHDEESSSKLRLRQRRGGVGSLWHHFGVRIVRQCGSRRASHNAFSTPEKELPRVKVGKLVCASTQQHFGGPFESAK